MNRLRLAAAAGASLVATGCVVSGTPVPAVDGAASLPFTPSIAGRINDRNDGSPFEPCTAYRPPELQSLGIDPGSVYDAGFSESPNFRGCNWKSADGTVQFWQIVSDEVSLAAYKRKHSYRPWRPDRSVGGRTVAVAGDGSDTCFAAFMSADAIVISSVRTTTAATPSAGLEQECAKAIGFATLAVARAP